MGEPLDDFRELMLSGGFRPAQLCLYEDALRGFLGSGVVDKSAWLAKLEEDGTDVHQLMAADVAIDLYRSKILGQPLPEDAGLDPSIAQDLSISSPLPEPPDALIELVVGAPSIHAYRASGQQSVVDIIAALKSVGSHVAGAGRVLDFGCGCARVLRYLIPLFNKETWYGSDANPEAIAWCKANLPYARFVTNAFTPPLGYSDSIFGVIYAMSVFSHIRPDVQDAWLAEFNRVLSRRGTLLVTTQGLAFIDSLSGRDRARFLSNEPVIVGGQHEGQNSCAVFCPPEEFKARADRIMRFVGFVPGGAVGNGNQDIWLLRKR